jgi:hypothetical protein
VRSGQNVRSVRSTQIPDGLRITLFLLLGFFLGADWAGCDTPATTLKTELEDLELLKTRLLVDLPAAAYGPRRLMYVENRNSSGWDGSGLLLPPTQWAVGFSGPLVTAGPVSLHGIFTPLYNPLAHGPASEVFAEPPELSLDIDLEVARRRGLQLSLIPGHWNLVCVYEQQIGAQLGSTIAISFGRGVDFALAGMLSSPPERIEDGWYSDRPLFPGGLISHLAGSVSWQLDPFALALIAAASGGRCVAGGTLLTLNLSLSTAPADLSLIFGFCSPQYFTPEGDSGDLEWIAAARIERDFGALHLSGGCSRELLPLPPFPEGFRESRDCLEAGIQVNSGSTSDLGWCMRADADMRREWSTTGRESFRCDVEARSTLHWSAWSLTAGMSEAREGKSEPVRDIRIAFGHDPAWGRIELEVGYQQSPAPGLQLAAAFDAIGEDKRFYIRAGTEEVLPLCASGDNRKDRLELFTLRLGWEAKCQWRSRQL